AAATPSAPCGLPAGAEPRPRADMLAARKPRQQVGVGRTGLGDALDRGDQNSTDAALAAATASIGMKRKPTSDSHRALAAITVPSTREPSLRITVSASSSKNIVLTMAI